MPEINLLQNKANKYMRNCILVSIPKCRLQWNGLLHAKTLWKDLFSWVFFPCFAFHFLCVLIVSYLRFDRFIFICTSYFGQLFVHILLAAYYFFRSKYYLIWFQWHLVFGGTRILVMIIVALPLLISRPSANIVRNRFALKIMNSVHCIGADQSSGIVYFHWNWIVEKQRNCLTR